jgi:signal transduction histidine kinase/CHASE1-domain containing sensor protein
MPGSSRRWRFVPLAMLMASLSLTAAATWVTEIAGDARDHVRFEREVERIELTLAHELDTHIAMLRGAAGLFATDEHLSRAQFSAYVDQLELRARFPGVQGIGYAEIVPESARAIFAERAHLGQVDAPLWPPSTLVESVPATYLEPRDARNRAALGFDMYSDATRRDAIDQARDRAAPIATARVTLVQEITQSKQFGFLIYLPLYRGRPPDTVEGRRHACFGFVYSPYRIDDLVVGAMAGMTTPVDFDIFDSQRLDAASRLYTGPAPRQEPRFVEERSFPFAGHAWSIRYRSQPEISSSREPVVALMGGGVAASALLWITSALLVRARERSEEALAEQRRSQQELERGQERLRLIASASAILSSSLDHPRTLTNVAAAAVPGFADWSAVDLLREDGTIQRLTVAHPDPRKVAIAHEISRLYPPSSNDPTYDVMATGKALLVESVSDEMLVAAARDADHLRLLRSLELNSVIIAPLLARDQPLGILTFVTAESKRRYMPEDAAVAEELARRAAIAIEHAQAHQEAGRLRAEAEQAREAVERHAAELARSNSELEQFAYVASHDLQEPLRMITNYLDLIGRRYGDRFSGPPAEFMGFVIEGAKRMQALIRDLLAFSRAGRGEPGAVVELDAGAVAREALQNLRGSIEEAQARVEVGELPHVRFDRMQLLQLLQNLIGNAVKFRGDAPARVEIGAERRSDAWEFFVRDNGIGIDSAHTARIFELFQRLHTRDLYAGTGIGLAICRKIVERRGGVIWVESRLGLGSTFRFTVPDTPVADESGAHRQPVLSGTSSG